MARPLSPFMFPVWYRFQITSALSILHRLTGIGLCLGLVALVSWVVAVALGGHTYAIVEAALQSPVGLAALFGWSVALYYHLASGVRHLVWDTGYGVSMVGARRGGAVVLLLTAALTAITWSLVVWA